MKSSVLIAGVTLITSLLLWLGVRVAWGREAEDARILLHNHNQIKQLDPKSRLFASLLKSSEEALHSAPAGNMMQRIVSAKDIDRIKRNEKSLEVLYPHAKELVVSTSKRKMKIDRLLIRFSTLASGGTAKNRAITLYYGEGDYSGSPYVNTEEWDEKLTKILTDMGVKADAEPPQSQSHK